MVNATLVLCFLYFASFFTYSSSELPTACNWTDEIRVLERRHHRRLMTKRYTFVTFVMDDGDEMRIQYNAPVNVYKDS